MDRSPATGGWPGTCGACASRCSLRRGRSSSGRPTSSLPAAHHAGAVRLSLLRSASCSIGSGACGAWSFCFPPDQVRPDRQCRSHQVRPGHVRRGRLTTARRPVSSGCHTTTGGTQMVAGAARRPRRSSTASPRAPGRPGGVPRPAVPQGAGGHGRQRLPRVGTLLAVLDGAHAGDAPPAGAAHRGRALPLPPHLGAAPAGGARRACRRRSAAWGATWWRCSTRGPPRARPPPSTARSCAARGGVAPQAPAAGVVPHTSIDTEAHWTKTGWHGWVYGWKLHLVVTAAAVWIPLAAELTPANAADNELAPALLPRAAARAALPAGRRRLRRPRPARGRRRGRPDPGHAPAGPLPARRRRRRGPARLPPAALAGHRELQRAVQGHLRLPRPGAHPRPASPPAASCSARSSSTN